MKTVTYQNKQYGLQSTYISKPFFCYGKLVKPATKMFILMDLLTFQCIKVEAF